ncbi:MAG TPA: zf-HC2 domain-containing protein [Patescibacteria group bacterium]|nr:zf-HC2 domain-containing protein [Patescibacteria group bacterium]
MDCAHIKELILTGYTDGQIDARLQEQVRAHLAACVACRQLADAVRKTAVEPFKKAERIGPPDAVWQRIKQALILEEERRPAGVLERLRDFLQGAYSLPRPVYATAAAMLVLLAAAAFARLPAQQQRTVNRYLQEEVEFITDLKVEPRTAAYDSLSTKIEKSFL